MISKFGNLMVASTRVSMCTSLVMWTNFGLFTASRNTRSDIISKKLTALLEFLFRWCNPDSSRLNYTQRDLKESSLFLSDLTLCILWTANIGESCVNLNDLKVCTDRFCSEALNARFRKSDYESELAKQGLVDDCSANVKQTTFEIIRTSENFKSP